MIYTASLRYPGQDKLNVSRQGNDPRGVIFAPSWGILKPALNSKKLSDALHEAHWPIYVEAYTEEMRRSYRAHRDEWLALASSPVDVTLVCYCPDPARCHRTVLAGILAKLGATLGGERPVIVGCGKPVGQTEQAEIQEWLIKTVPPMFEVGQRVWYVGRAGSEHQQSVQSTIYRGAVGGSDVFCYVDSRETRRPHRRPRQRRQAGLFATQAEAEAALPRRKVTT